LGIDLGGTNIKIGCFDSNIDLIGKTSTPTRADMGADSVVETMAETARELLADAGFPLDNVRAVGIGSPGPLDLTNGIVVSIPTMPLFKNVPLRKMLSDRLGKPTVMEKDANAAAWGEHVRGAGKGVDEMALLTLGTGIGGAVISNGKLVHGFGDDAAELGHIIIYPEGRVCDCGQRGCAEAYASANSVAARAVEAIEGGAESSLKKVLQEKGEVTCPDVYEHMEKGDNLAKEITE
ncbi:unnamed protein product, partial [marine sediment metagenome]